ncbi:TPA: hypothetical protein ACH3X2_008965 [Trebouxia sp. C0005]
MSVPVYARDRVYHPDVQDHTCSLGKGGCFTTVERYFANDSRAVVAVKKMPKHKLDYIDLFLNEIKALNDAKRFGVPRVVKYIEAARSKDDVCLVLELVRGTTLSKLMCSSHTHSQEGWEQQMLEVAAQLLDTLEHLHMRANVCHLDLTITNVMLQDDRSNGWDVLRLIDFGFAQKFNTGFAQIFLNFIKTDLGDGPYFDVRVKDVKPIGTTTPYAAPELLCFIQRQWEDDEEGVMINGPAADIWSFGCVCYQMLTGDLPFLADHKCAISAPDYLAEELHPAWEEYQATIECQWFWEDACEVATREGRPVNHPLIDRVRECSATPDAAADFFRLLFQFEPEKRLLHDAACHAYLSATFDRLNAASSISWDSSSDVVEDGGFPGHDDGGESCASSVEEMTEQVHAQQPSQTASAPSLLQASEHQAMQTYHHPPNQLQSLHTDAGVSAQLATSSIPLPGCQEHNLVESSSCDDRQPPCKCGVLMPQDPCIQPKSDFTPSQQHSNKVAGPHGPCRGVSRRRACYAAGAVCGIALGLGVALGLRKLWN